MKSTIITLALFGSVALAQPARSHKRNGRDAHAHNAHHKREIVWETVVDVVTEYIDITSTVWVNAGATPVPSTTLSTKAAAPTTLSISTQDAQFYSVAPVPTTSLVSVAPVPTTTPVYVAPAPVPTTSAYVAPVVSSQEPAPAPSTTLVPVYVAPTTTPAVAAVQTTAAASVQAASGGSSYSGSCSAGSPCDGSITFYDTGMGACGWVNDGTTENVVALPHGLMGTQSNGNPFCGMTITISVGGKTTTAKVVDKCMGCVNNHIDLSRAAFDKLADEALGVTNAKWWFN